MTNIIMTLTRLSFLTSIMALIVLGIRFCLRKAPKTYTYILWIFVFIRAIMPASYTSDYSLWNLMQSFFSTHQTTAPAANAETLNAISKPVALPRGAATAVSQTNEAAYTTQNPFNPWVIAAAFWALGMSIMLIYSLYSMQKLRKTVEFSTLSKTAHASANCRIYESGQIKTAFILGFFSPAIYLPKGLDPAKKQMILEHESVHIRRHDHQIKMAAWIILSLHWFNPLMWVSFWFLNKDMELSCDEQVLINLGSQIRADYSSLLLDLAMPNRISSGMPLAFSEGNTKIRIKNILAYRPVKFGASTAAILLICITIYGCMGNPKTETTVPETEQTKQTEIQNEGTELPATPEDEEKLAFLNTFLDNLVNCRAEEIYAVLSPELKTEADTFMNNSFGVTLNEPKKHRRINPFTPTEAPVIEKTDSGYHYTFKRPDNYPLPEYEKFHSSDVWEGFLTLEETDSGIQVTEWQDGNYNEIASREEFNWQFQYYTFEEEAETELNWLNEHPDEVANLYYYNRANEEPEKILTERFHLKNGTVTDVNKDKEKEMLITYSWDDGSVVFRMEQLYNDIWYVTGADMGN